MAPSIILKMESNLILVPTCDSGVASALNFAARCTVSPLKPTSCGCCGIAERRTDGDSPIAKAAKSCRQFNRSIARSETEDGPKPDPTQGSLGMEPDPTGGPTEGLLVEPASATTDPNLARSGLPPPRLVLNAGGL